MPSLGMMTMTDLMVMGILTVPMGMPRGTLMTCSALPAASSSSQVKRELGEGGSRGRSSSELRRNFRLRVWGRGQEQVQAKSFELQKGGGGEQGQIQAEQLHAKSSVLQKGEGGGGTGAGSEP